MRFVIDTNSIIAALIKNGISRRIIRSPAFQFITPEYTLIEIKKHEKLICKKAKISKNQFNILLNIIFERITIVPKEEYEEFFNNSKNLVDDVGDVPFIALYLASKADGIWSDDTHFKTRNEIIVFRTKELATAFKSPNSK